MPDFLSRLAARTMGLTPSVQPLVTPMYGHRPISASEQPGLLPFDSDINAPAGTGLAPARTWTGPWRLQEHAPTDGDRALPLQEEYAEKTHKNHPLADDGSPASHPFNTTSQPDPELAPAFGASHPTVPSFSVEHKDGASILAEETTLHRRDVPLWPPNKPEQMHGLVRKDGDHKNIQFAQHDHSLPMNESPQSTGSFPPLGELSQAGISAPDPLSIAENTPNRDDGFPSQQRMPLTGDIPVHPQPHTNGAREQQRSIGNVLGRAETELGEERTPLQDWAALLPMQPVSGTEVSQSAGHGSLKRGNFGGITHQTGHDEILPIEATTPSIQVTIGRIEVRATPPPPTRSPAQRTAPSVMSLDDYVNQRMKGGR